jgi:hypothetical protein
MASPCSWHCAALARALLADLAPNDLQLVRNRGGPGPDGLDWYPSSDHGAATFEALARLRQQAIGPAFDVAAALRAPTVTGAIARRFGDPERWRGFGPIEATRRFRALHRDARHAV